MTTYLIQASYTAQGFTGLIQSSEDRSGMVRSLAEGLGGTLESFYRSEVHTSELQSHRNLVCRLLFEKKKKIKIKLPAGLFPGPSRSFSRWPLLIFE